MTLNEGGYCTVDILGFNDGANRFEIRADGYGCYGGFCAGKVLSLTGFRASKNSDRIWTIQAVP